MAYGLLCMRPGDFWELTPFELWETYEAHIWAEREKNEADYYRTAWLASHIMNVSRNLKRPVSPDELLGRKQEAKKITKEKRNEEFQKLLQKFNKIV